ncbi:MAG TPA: hypothetical protein PLM08_04815, partial [Polyangiaceae bacterium]|nr:hypothetical protein [Polyangiaceae bacterium]
GRNGVRFSSAGRGGVVGGRGVVLGQGQWMSDVRTIIRGKSMTEAMGMREFWLRGRIFGDACV